MSGWADVTPAWRRTVLIDALERVAAGGTVLDPDVVAHFLGRQGRCRGSKR